MPGTPAESVGPSSLDPRDVIARAAVTDARDERALRRVIDDVLLSPEERLDDRTRVALRELVSGLVRSVENDLRTRAGVAGGDGQREGVDRGLVTAGLLRDADFVEECLAQARLDVLGAAMPVTAPDIAGTPSLLARLMHSPDPAIAGAARDLMAGENDHRAMVAGGGRGAHLPANLHERLVWWVAASLRTRLISGIEDAASADRAISQAALQSIAAHDDARRPEAAALRLAEAIGASAGELAPLLEETVRDRRLTLFCALLATGLGTDFGSARATVLEAGGERLWLALRTLTVPRASIARIGFALCEGDPRRDVERFADLLDVVMAITPADAGDALAPLRLHPAYRAAIAALDRGRAR